MARKIHEVSPQEAQMCRLKAQGYQQNDAYRIAYSKPTMDGDRVNEKASRICKKPQVQEFMRELFAAGKKLEILNHAQFLHDVRRDWAGALVAKNYTAAASFARLAGQAIGTLSETLNLTDERMTDEQLLDKLAGDNPEVAAALRKVVGGRTTFH